MDQPPEVTGFGTDSPPFVEHELDCGVVRLSPDARYALSEPTVAGAEPVTVVIERGLLWAAIDGDGGGDGPALQVAHQQGTIGLSSGRLMLDAGPDGDGLIVVVEGGLDVSTEAGTRHHLTASAAAELTPAGRLVEVPGIGWADFLADPWANVNLRRDQVLSMSSPRADRPSTLADALPDAPWDSVLPDADRPGEPPVAPRWTAADPLVDGHVSPSADVDEPAPTSEPSAFDAPPRFDEPSRFEDPPWLPVFDDGDAAAAPPAPVDPSAPGAGADETGSGADDSGPAGAFGAPPADPSMPDAEVHRAPPPDAGGDGRPGPAAPGVPPDDPADRALDGVPSEPSGKGPRPTVVSWEEAIKAPPAAAHAPSDLRRRLFAILLIVLTVAAVVIVALALRDRSDGAVPGAPSRGPAAVATTTA